MMTNVFIISCAIGVGKSTLVKKLREQVPTGVLHFLYDAQTAWRGAGWP